jgi:hypothetical protein
VVAYGTDSNTGLYAVSEKSVAIVARGDKAGINASSSGLGLGVAGYGWIGVKGTGMAGVLGQGAIGVMGKSVDKSNAGVYGEGYKYGVKGDCSGKYTEQGNGLYGSCYGLYTEDKVFAGNGITLGASSSSHCGRGATSSITPDQIHTCALQDIAEDIPAADDVGPGDVVVIDSESLVRVVKSTKAYDTAVAGIISATPGMLINTEDSDTPLALAGRVVVKASTENGPIKAGDLLTTSNTAGHIMKCKDKMKCYGAIVGKALSDLDKGTGKVITLVTLS